MKVKLKLGTLDDQIIFYQDICLIYYMYSQALKFIFTDSSPTYGIVREN